MKYVLPILALFYASLFAFLNESQVCQSCHPTIYNEYYDSSHRKASVMNDPVFKAVWDLHPDKGQGNFTCSECHSPSDKGAELTKVLVENTVQEHAPISCVYCHTIEDVQEHAESNKNVMSGKKKHFFSADKEKKEQSNLQFKKGSDLFGLNKTTSGSAYHKIDYTNENYYNGNICMGCHSHRLNKNGIDIYMLDAKIDVTDKETCISCHMPQITGSKVNLYDSGTHAYHSIAGIYRMSKKMGDYIDFKIQKSAAGFSVDVFNKANHALFGHPLRAGILKVQLTSQGKTTELEPFVFSRLLSKEGKPAMSWEADDAMSDTLLYAKKSIAYDTVLKEGDKVTLTLGLYVVNPLLLEILNLQDNKEVQEFTVLKKELFSF